jgi:predicted nucleic acid-binding protein
VRAALESDPGPRIIPAGILAEIAYLVEHRLGSIVLDAFLSDVESGGVSYDCGEEDFPRVRELVVRYADLRLGCADACVIACGERNGGRILTLDQRDFGIVAREGTITLVPEVT